jgi:ribosomal-protein-alanine N-acetyltransferase
VRASSARRAPPLKLRGGRSTDVDALVALERAVFTYDLLSRRSFRHFLSAPGATLLIAEHAGTLVGYVLVLYPPRSQRARLYSVAVAPHLGSRGIGKRLLAAGEQAARHHHRQVMQVEVHEHNTRAISWYEKSGYRLFGRHRRYYDDHADALRFEKPLGAQPRRRAAALPAPA